MGAGIIANEEQLDHYRNRHENPTLVQKVPEIQRAAAQPALMRNLARLAEKLARHPSLRQRFEKLKFVWGTAF